MARSFDNKRTKIAGSNFSIQVSAWARELHSKKFAGRLKVKRRHSDLAMLGENACWHEDEVNVIKH